jgi:hypothetical protein
LTWPVETGGEATLDSIKALCQRSLEERGLSDEIDPKLDAILSPERRRLQSSMKEAINRVLSLVYET